MRILVIGGTGFVGRHFVEAATAAGLEVTLFNRGISGAGLFPGLERIAGDRRNDLGALRGRRWDAVVDMCGYAPDDVRASVALLRDQAERYVYVSSVMAYRDWGLAKQNEASPLYSAEDADAGQTSTVSYRLRRADCDRLVREELPGRALVIRPGLIVGPFDPNEKLAYWAMRAVRGGDALAPGDPDRRVQAIDARDLARWLVAMIGEGRTGVFNACGRGIAMKTLLGTCRSAAGGKAKFIWVGDEFLLERVSTRRDIRQRPLQFLELLPFWIPGLDDRFDSSAAKKSGLTWRSLSDTARDTLASMAARRELSHAFLSPEREASLLREWRLRKTI